MTTITSFTKTPLGLFMMFCVTCVVALMLMGLSAMANRYDSFFPDWDRILNLLAFILAEMIAQRLAIGVDRAFSVDECARKAVTNMNLVRTYMHEFCTAYDWEPVPEFYNIKKLKNTLAVDVSEIDVSKDEEYMQLMDSTVIHMAMENKKDVELYLRCTVIPYCIKQNSTAKQKADLTIIFDRIANCLDAVDTLNTATLNVVPAQFHNLLLIIVVLFCGLIIPMSLASSLGLLHSVIVVYVTAAIIYYTITKAHQMDRPSPKEIQETKTPGSEAFDIHSVSDAILNARHHYSQPKSRTENTRQKRGYVQLSQQ